MNDERPNKVTRLLDRVGRGEGQAADELLPLVYDELRSLAAAYFRRERSDHTLQPTALVNEVYVRLAQQENPEWANRAHFFAVASKAMRNILVNHAVARAAEKRGGGRAAITLNSDVAPSSIKEIDAIELNDVLDRLAALDERKAKVVELRFFGGLTVEEVAHVLGVSLSTIEADWRLAKAWLSKELS
jgi:RNA polymerase sigma-70 factor, ECF subfamily